MKKLHYLLYGLILFIPYFLRPDLAGNDPYFYMAQICRADYIPHGVEYNLFIEILPLIPCDIFIIKLILLSLFLISLILIKEIGDILYYEYSGFLVLLSPILLLEFLKFENEVFSFPFLMAATYYFIRYKTITKSIEDLFGCASFLLIGFLFWKGAVFYGISFLLPYIIPVLVAILIIYPDLITIIWPSLIPELVPFAILGLAFLVMGVTNLDKFVKYQAWFFIILGLMQNRFLVHALPYLAFGLEERLFKKWGEIRPFLYYIPFIWILSIFTIAPGAIEWDAVEEAVKLSGETGKPIYNEWHYGYWIHYKGGDSNYFGWAQDTPFKCPGIHLKNNLVFEC